ncbi:threonine aldolase family protein [Nakamurella leprariae]|uniref:Low specificity L-threonine aldolase n=1 Tax=Nakamurella leprariae TaxID=2803911 RepID=A0A938YFI1_9ACTN|nr:low specificity L-threonine aldolase [Nakamurella leprariae]
MTDPAPTAGAGAIAPRTFASDNYAGAHPEVLAAIAAANVGHQVAYGDDVWTARLQDVVRDRFGPAATAFPVFNGTAANVVSLLAVLPRWGAVVCAETAHINTDENGAPERIGGIKLLGVPTPDGKLTPELIDRQAWGWGDQHHAQPLVVSISQSTELGTLYTVDELRAITEHAHTLGMRVHLDGSRLSNAAAALDVPLRALTTDVGIDLLSLGGTKNGLLFGEAVVVLDPELAGDGPAGITATLPYLRKYTMQLASKMRFISAQLVALYEDDLWLRSARHANAMAARLSAGMTALGQELGPDSVRVARPVAANAVFGVLDPRAADLARERFRFYDWDRTANEVRWMCSFDTTEADVDALVDVVRTAVLQVRSV